MTCTSTARYLIFLGAPGAGKGTQAGVLSESLGLPSMASGDVFRSVRREESELGELVRSYYDQGRLVPDDVTIRVIQTVLTRPEYASGAMLDGFPRTLEQAHALDGTLAGSGGCIWRVVYMRVEPEELIRRISGRMLCRGCGAVYHKLYNPPVKADVCDVCGCELYQRVDDAEETARMRIDTFLRETQPLVEYYRSKGKLCEVDGGQSMEAVSRDIQACLAEYR